MAIPESIIDSVEGSDKVKLYDSSNGDAERAFSLDTLKAYLQGALAFSESVEYITQYSSPSATGFSVAINDDSSNTHLILTPTAGFAAGTITLPAVANCIDKQRILINCTQSVATLTIDGNGATAVTGEPASLSANDYFLLKYDAVSKSWYRVG